jgi:hypothetical protein
MEINNDYPAAQKRVKETLKMVDKRYDEVFRIVARY